MFPNTSGVADAISGLDVPGKEPVQTLQDRAGKLLAVPSRRELYRVATLALGQRCGFDKGSISVSEGVLGVSGSHPYPLLSISYGP